MYTRNTLQTRIMHLYSEKMKCVSCESTASSASTHANNQLRFMHVKVEGAEEDGGELRKTNKGRRTQGVRGGSVGGRVCGWVSE